MPAPPSGPAGTVSLSQGIEALRNELTRLWLDGDDQGIRFRPDEVELTLEVVATSSAKGEVGVRWWLLTAGGGAESSSEIRQTIKLRLTPTLPTALHDGGLLIEARGE